ncbi:hypothetical protein [Streptomyces sp. MJM1172]|uniref:hypothetical protein n=1 Tax=Streptomyces sp. MJM1172 TaxID=1703926 RepID=UPI001161461C|nr:hypothetical protein [Streptomyces sp. MJM1172]
MSTETAAADKTNDEIAAEVKTYIDGLIETEFPKYNKGDKDKIEALYEQGERELLRVSANKRAVWRTLLKTAKTEAMERPAGGAGTALVLHAETTTVEEIAGYAEIIDHTAEKMAEGIRAEVSANETARILAEAILDARLRVYDKKGRPDLKGTRDASKKLTGRIKSAAAQKLVESGFKDNVADVDDLMDTLQVKITYQMSAVLPEFVRALDTDKEQFAELFPMYTDKVTDDKSASDILFEEYKINPLSQKERSAQNRQKNNELAANGSAKEVEGGEGENEGEGEGTPDTTQYDKDKGKLEKMGKDLAAVVGHSGDYDDTQRAELVKLITANLTALSDALNKLSAKGE